MVRRDYKNNPMLNGSDDGFQEALRIFLEGKNRRPGGSPLHQTLRHILFWLKNIFFFWTIDLYDKLSLSSWIPTSPCFNKIDSQSSSSSVSLYILRTFGTLFRTKIDSYGQSMSRLENRNNWFTFNLQFIFWVDSI